MTSDRKKMSQVAPQFMGSNLMGSNLSDVNPTVVASEAVQPESSEESLRTELLGNLTAEEPTIRLTVDLPRALHRRLNQLSLDSGKPKSELARIMIRRSLESVDY
ncbi:MAG: hypothetical protein ACRC8A_07860 [Microcoleaceae cyanobacterium]